MPASPDSATPASADTTSPGIAPGDLLVWVQDQPPVRAFAAGTGPYLSLSVALREVSAGELADLGLDPEEAAWWWAMEVANAGEPVAVPASVVVAVVSADWADLGQYYPQG